MTKTQSRIDFLRTCLVDKGMSRPEAAKALSKKDKKVSIGYATTLVYQMFSGSDYAVSKKPTKVSKKPTKKKTTQNKAKSSSNKKKTTSSKKKGSNPQMKVL